MKRVVIESPYQGDVERNVKYARACMRDSLERGEAPIASHLLYTQEGILNDNVPAQRTLGILAGRIWLEVTQLVVFYVDYGWSPGMEEVFEFVQDLKIPNEIRKINVKQDALETDLDAYDVS